MNDIKKEKKIYRLVILLLSIMLAVIIVFNIFYFTKPKYNVFNDCSSKVVEVKASTEDYGTSYGTGTIIDDDFTILTNSHVISFNKANEYFLFDKIEIRLTYDNSFQECEIIKNDKNKDLTLLKPKNVSNNKVNSFKIKQVSFFPSDVVFAIGNNSYNGISISKGIITMPSFDLTYNEIKRNVIQVDITISNGNSGGPLVNEKGLLLGLISFKLKDNHNQIIEGIAYALSVEEIILFLNN